MSYAELKVLGAGILTVILYLIFNSFGMPWSIDLMVSVFFFIVLYTTIVSDIFKENVNDTKLAKKRHN